MQLSSLNLHRAIEHANTTRLCTGHTHTHTHAAWSVYEMVSQVSTSPPMTHPAWRQQPVLASAGDSTKLIGQRNEEIICSLTKSSNVQNQNNQHLCVWFGILNKLCGIGQNQSYLYHVENDLKMKTGFRWMEMYLDPHLLVFLSRLSRCGTVDILEWLKLKINIYPL